MGRAVMETRYASITRLRPERREEYLELHLAVWPEVEARLRSSNIGNYSIFLVGDLLLSYYEYSGDDHEADLAAIASDPNTKQWWTLTDPCQEPLGLDDTQGPWSAGREIWHLN